MGQAWASDILPVSHSLTNRKKHCSIEFGLVLSDAVINVSVCWYVDKYDISCVADVLGMHWLDDNDDNPAIAKRLSAKNKLLQTDHKRILETWGEKAQFRKQVCLESDFLFQQLFWGLLSRAVCGRFGICTTFPSEAFQQ